MLCSFKPLLMLSVVLLSGCQTNPGAVVNCNLGKEALISDFNCSIAMLCNFEPVLMLAVVLHVRLPRPTRVRW